MSQAVDAAKGEGSKVLYALNQHTNALLRERLSVIKAQHPARLRHEPRVGLVRHQRGVQPLAQVHDCLPSESEAQGQSLN